MDAQEQQRLLLLGFASLKQDIRDLRERLESKVPYLLTEEAIEGFRRFLETNEKPNTTRSFKKLLECFEVDFPAQNIVVIPPVTLQEFLARHWGSAQKSSLKQIVARLNWFYAWSIKYCQSKGFPAFTNPCIFIEVSGKVVSERPDFLPVEKMREFLGTAKQEAHWLIFAILMTAGLRSSELIGDKTAKKEPLKKLHVSDRIITIENPKSGADKELAVIPSWVAERLTFYLRNKKDSDIIFPVCYSTLYEVVSTHAKWIGCKFSPHYLRKWCTSFWSEVGERDCSDFVLRHHPSLRERYVALPIARMLSKQDELLKPELFGAVEP